MFLHGFVGDGVKVESELEQVRVKVIGVLFGGLVLRKLIENSVESITFHDLLFALSKAYYARNTVLDKKLHVTPIYAVFVFDLEKEQRDEVTEQLELLLLSVLLVDSSSCALSLFRFFLGLSQIF